MLKTRVEIVTGFLGGGKTTFLNILLNETAVWEEHIVVLQLEDGQESLKLTHVLKAYITCLPILNKPLTLSYLKNIIIAYEPDRLIIEYNGMYPLEHLLNLFYSQEISSRAYISTLFNLIEGPTFSMYWQNLRPILMPGIEASHMVLVTKSHLLSESENKKIKDILEAENNYAHILFVEDRFQMAETLKRCTLLDKGWSKVLRITLSGGFKRIFNRNEVMK